jgi:hypothetical protein
VSENTLEDEEHLYSEDGVVDDRDYSTRMDEILGDDEEQDKSDEEMFTYSGIDAALEGPKDYNAQLKDILGPDDEEAEERDVEEELRQFDDSDEFVNQIITEKGPVSR